jgi:hypothetical protein
MNFHSTNLFLFFLLITTSVLCIDEREEEEAAEDVERNNFVDKEDRMMLMNAEGETDIEKQSPGFIFS